MAGNTYGKLFKITTWGESHGKALGVVIDGCPPNIPLSEKDIQKEVDKRKPTSTASTSRKEEDKVEILSGVFEGKTTGTPISIIVYNKDQKSVDYNSIKNLFRPGHADYTYELKYGIRDYRGGGRSSGRETISRVMAGAIAKKIMSDKYRTEIFGHTIQIGEIKASKFDKKHLERSELKCADGQAEKEMLKLINNLKAAGDSVGAIVEIVIKNPPKGLGEPVFDKLDAELAKAMMSIGAVKGVAIGSGFDAAIKKGSENNDQMMTCRNSNKSSIKFLSNNCGGILGGISTGEDIIIKLAVKPVSSIPFTQKTITKNGKDAIIKTLGRHDICLAPRIIPIAESMSALVLLDFSLQKDLF